MAEFQKRKLVHASLRVFGLVALGIGLFYMIESDFGGVQCFGNTLGCNQLWDNNKSGFLAGGGLVLFGLLSFIISYFFVRKNPFPLSLRKFGGIFALTTIIGGFGIVSFVISYSEAQCALTHCDTTLPLVLVSEGCKASTEQCTFGLQNWNSNKVLSVYFLTLTNATNRAVLEHLTLNYPVPANSTGNLTSPIPSSVDSGSLVGFDIITYGDEMSGNITVQQ